MKTIQEIQSEAPILKQTLELYKEFSVYIKTFPKKDQYLLGRRCDEYMLDFMEYIVCAVSKVKSERLALLMVASTKFEVLKLLFRVARDLKMIDNKKP